MGDELWNDGMDEMDPFSEQGYMSGLTDPVPQDYGITAPPQVSNMYVQTMDSMGGGEQSYGEREPITAEYEGGSGREPIVAEPDAEKPETWQDWDPLTIARRMDPEAFDPKGIKLTTGQQIRVGLNEAANIIGMVFRNQDVLDETRLWRHGFERAQEKLASERRRTAYDAAESQVKTKQWQAQQEQLRQAAQVRDQHNRAAEMAILAGKNPIAMDPTTPGGMRPVTTQELDKLLDENRSPGVTHPDLPLIVFPDEAMKARQRKQGELDAMNSPEGKAARQEQIRFTADKAKAARAASIAAEKEGGVRDASGAPVGQKKEAPEKPKPQDITDQEASSKISKWEMPGSDEEKNSLANEMRTIIAGPYISDLNKDATRTAAARFGIDLGEPGMPPPPQPKGKAAPAVPLQAEAQVVLQKPTVASFKAFQDAAAKVPQQQSVQMLNAIGQRLAQQAKAKPGSVPPDLMTALLKAKREAEAQPGSP